MGPVSRYLDYAAMTLINRTTPILIPIPNADGQIYARITGIAAISRNCKNTTASELLLTFLISDRWQKKGTDVGSTVLYGFPIKKSAMKSWFQDETLTYLDKLPCERLNGQTLESFIIWYDKNRRGLFQLSPKRNSAVDIHKCRNRTENLCRRTKKSRGNTQTTIKRVVNKKNKIYSQLSLKN